MASGALAIPSSYHKPTPSVRKSKLDATQVRSEDELLKFFLHGSYDVQRGAATSHPPSSPTATATNETQEKAVCIPDKHELSSTVVHEESKSKSRCMFEETYMINISVQQPDAVPSSKQIDVRIEKTPSDLPMPTEKIDADEISSIFDEEEDDDHDEIDSVIFNELSPADSQAPATKLTLADMINKTLTTIPGTKVDQLKNITTNHKWFMNKPEEIRTAKPVEEMPPLKAHKKPSHPTLTANKTEDERLFEYLDYLETKEESNSPLKTSTAIPTNDPSKSLRQQSIPIVDLEQLCRSLTVNDLKDESIRKKIFELKLIIDERHKKSKSQIPQIKPRKDHLPVLIAMPAAVQQQRRRTTVVQPTTTLLQSKTVNFPPPYNPPYYEMMPNTKQSPSSNPQAYPRRSNPPTNNNRKYQFT